MSYAYASSDEDPDVLAARRWRGNVTEGQWRLIERRLEAIQMSSMAAWGAIMPNPPVGAAFGDLDARAAGRIVRDPDGKYGRSTKDARTNGRKL